MLKPNVKLMDHQSKAVEMAIRNNGQCAFFMDLGTGKCLSSLATFIKFRESNPSLKLLVICPISLIRSSWGCDIEKFTTLTYCNLREGKVTNADIYIVNFEYFLSEKKTLVISDLTEKSPMMCVIDESARIRNHGAITTKRILSLRNKFIHRIVLSGVPAPNVESEYWSQISFVRGGIFHDRFSAFRNTYFHLERDGAIMPRGAIINKATARDIFRRGFKYTLSNKNRELLLSALKPICHYARKKECLDLPEETDEIRSLEMGAKQRAAYLQMKRHLVLELENTDIAAPVALTKILKLREICSGFVLDEQGKAFDVGENPKLAELQNVLEEVGNNQAIIWCEFHHEIETVKRLLGDKSACLYGETKDKDQVIQDFKDGKTQYLIAHPKSAGHGLTFVNCNVQIFYALSYSYELYTQAKGRTHRAGQVNPCTYIHLICKDSIEEVMLDVLRRKGSAQDILREVMKK